MLLCARNTHPFAVNFTQKIHLGWLSAEITSSRLHNPGLGRNIWGDFFNLEQRLSTSIENFLGSFLLELSEAPYLLCRCFILLNLFGEGKMIPGPA